MHQILIDFGMLQLGNWRIPLHIYGYGLMLVLGFATALYLARWRARRMGENPEVLTHCGILALVGGIAGARIAYILQHWDTYFSSTADPLVAIVNISSGGLIYYGGLVLATVMVLIYLRLKKLSIRRTLDILAVSLMVGLAFGRAGCLLNGCCYGVAAADNAPLAMRFPMYAKPLVKLDGRDNPFSEKTEMPSPPYAHQMDQYRIHPDPNLLDAQGQLIPPRDFTDEQIVLAEASHSHAVLPAQVLGIVNALLIAALLMLFYRHRTREGQVFALLLMLYPITRFVLESLRDDNPHHVLSGVLTHNQYTSLGMLVVGTAMMLLLQRAAASAGPIGAQRQTQTQSAPAMGSAKHHNKRKAKR